MGYITIWECRECHERVYNAPTVEYDGTLPAGWVEPCGSNLAVVYATCPTCRAKRRPQQFFPAAPTEGGQE